MAKEEFIDSLNGKKFCAERAAYTAGGIDIEDTLNGTLDRSSLTGSSNISVTEDSSGITIASLIPTGATGQQGLPGDTGIGGDTGNRGDTGDRGSTGIQGNTGDRGNTGIQGGTGDRGNTGIQGNRGSTGDRGTTGTTSTGQTGDTGLRGDTGTSATGPRGSTGDRGNTGTSPTGARGSTGSRGGTGLMGPTGYCGPKGNTGLRGSTGRTSFATGIESNSWTNTTTSSFNITTTEQTIQTIGSSGRFTLLGVAVWTTASSTPAVVIKVSSTSVTGYQNIVIQANTKKSVAYFLLQPSSTPYSITAKSVSGSPSATIRAAYTTLKFTGMT